MSRPRNPLPTYRLHKPSNVAFSDFFDPISGEKKTVSLGEWQSEKSKQEYARLCAELSAGRPSAASDSITVNEIAAAFWRHAVVHYRRADGTSTHELNNYRQVLKILRELYGFAPAAEFGPLALKACRSVMVERGWCRRLVNQQTGRIRRVFKFAVGEELVRPSILEGLRAVTGLQTGRTVARETAPIEPVPEADIEAALKFLNRTVAGMVRFHRLTGCRPGEVLSLKWSEIDKSGPVWAYRPGAHKMAYRGKKRAVFLGPQAREILEQFPTENPDDFVFSPTRELAERSKLRAENRKTVFYSTRGNKFRARVPKKAPRGHYDTCSYNRAVRRACEKAGVPVWNVARLRHSFATEVRKKFGLEAAQVLLGHSSADITQIYAQRDEAAAAKVAAEIG